MNIEIDDDSFVIHVMPDNLKFEVLKRLDEAFDEFDMIFMANDFNLLKLKFSLKRD